MTHPLEPQPNFAALSGNIVQGEHKSKINFAFVKPQPNFAALSGCGRCGVAGVYFDKNLLLM